MACDVKINIDTNGNLHVVCHVNWCTLRPPKPLYYSLPTLPLSSLPQPYLTPTHHTTPTYSTHTRLLPTLIYSFRDLPSHTQCNCEQMLSVPPLPLLHAHLAHSVLHVIEVDTVQHDRDVGQGDTQTLSECSSEGRTA